MDLGRADTTMNTITLNRDRNLTPDLPVAGQFRPGAGLKLKARFKPGSLAVLAMALLGLGCCTSFAPAARAQGGLDNMVYAVGTVSKDAANRDWAFLLWQGTSPSLLSGQTFAIYGKNGDANSAAPYQRKAVVALQTDERAIEPLLRRSVNVGENLAQLQTDMLTIFDKLVPTNTINRAEQLSAIIRGSLVDEEHYNNLVLLSRLHPGVNMALGVAHAEIITNQTTFEIRQYDVAGDKDVAVIGRVTVVPGVPTVLPRPDAPVVFPDPSAKGDLNIKLRWGTPDGLRRLALMHYGFNVYRVAKSYAEAPSNNWHLVPPTPVILTNRAAQGSPLVKRLNRLPIITDVDLTAAEAANFTAPTGDTNTFYYSDDDGRFKPGYTNCCFTNGAQFYYFATARDILSRDGFVSFGTLATVCDRMPPPAPRNLKVVNHYSYAGGVEKQFLRVYWDQNTNNTPSDTTSNYWVYRWISPTEMQQYAGNRSNNLIAIVRHTNGVAKAGYLDNGPGSPGTNDFGKTYWYSVRAQDAGACGPNLSGNSAPAFGVLRDRVGPPAPTGEVVPSCLKPDVALVSIGTPQPGTSGKIAFHFKCARTSPKISWVRFHLGVFYPQTGTFVEEADSPQMFYSPGQSVVSFDYVTGTSNYSRYLYIYPTAAMLDGTTASATPIPLPIFESWIGKEIELDFVAYLQRASGSRLCPKHDPVNPDGSHTNIVVTVNPTTGSKEWRLYRRVDDGPLSLICQGPITNIASILTCFDDSPPPNYSKICYFAQLLDEHGNPSPLVPLGCTEVSPSTTPPTPMLSPLVPTGNTNNPGMSALWFCAPPGVERFQVWIAGSMGVSSNLAPGFLSLSSTSPIPQTLVINGVTNNYEFHTFLSPRVGPGFGPGPQFAVPATIQMGNQYTVFVKAMARDGTVGDPSNVEQFTWAPTNIALPQVPWPARGLPPINSSFHPFLLSSYVQSSSANFTGAVVLVGFNAFAPANFASVSGRPQYVTTDDNPLTFLHTNKNGQSPFPLTLYRYQVTNANFPKVSGDITQVSPLMENIAYEVFKTNINFGNQTLYITNNYLRDPFVLYDFLPINDTLHFFYVYLLDTQPVISGARYRYLLVRFKDNREIDQVIPTNEMNVP